MFVFLELKQILAASRGYFALRTVWFGVGLSGVLGVVFEWLKYGVVCRVALKLAWIGCSYSGVEVKDFLLHRKHYPRYVINKIVYNVYDFC